MDDENQSIINAKKEEKKKKKLHDEVVWYVLYRPLLRPKTSFRKALFFLFLFLISYCLIILLLYLILIKNGLIALLFSQIKTTQCFSQKELFVFISIAIFIVFGFFLLKRASVGAIHLYQRYAPEYLRRKCLCKPTCSEYAILAIEKYGFFHGLHKTYIRLSKTCKGREYKIDFP